MSNTRRLSHAVKALVGLKLLMLTPPACEMVFVVFNCSLP
jgi:hypothetical protein